MIIPGGRNVTVSLQSRTGHTNMLAVVGALVFTQYWYWFPLAHCLALAFTPTCLIALNAQLKMPKLEFRSNARPSVYAYPAPLEEKKREEREKITTAVLSIAARARRRESERRARDSHEKMDVVRISIVIFKSLESSFIIFLLTKIYQIYHILYIFSTLLFIINILIFYLNRKEFRSVKKKKNYFFLFSLRINTKLTIIESKGYHEFYNFIL